MCRAFCAELTISFGLYNLECESGIWIIWCVIETHFWAIGHSLIRSPVICVWPECGATPAGDRTAMKLKSASLVSGTCNNLWQRRHGVAAAAAMCVLGIRIAATTFEFS